MFSKTFFILTPSFHGATLLSKLINAHPRITALGDTYPTNEFDQTCGCRKKVSQCTYWQNIMSFARKEHSKKTRSMLPLYPGEHGSLAGRLMYSDFTSFWCTPYILRHLRSYKHLSEFRSDYENFQAAVYQYTPNPGDIFVDGVKFVSRVSALYAAGYSVDGIIHLYRDPRDFVMSSIKNTERGGAIGVAEHALRYRLYHTRARQMERLTPHIDIYYENLIDDVDEQLARLFRFIGVEPMTVNELSPFFAQEWHFMGNDSLFSFNGEFRRTNHVIDNQFTKTFIHLLAGNYSPA